MLYTALKFFTFLVCTVPVPLLVRNNCLKDLGLHKKHDPSHGGTRKESLTPDRVYIGDVMENL